MAHGTTDMDAPDARAAARELAEASRDPAALAAARERHERRAAERETLDALIAHDLKNPLSSVRFGAELLLHDPATPQRVRFLAEQIIASTDGAFELLAAYLEPTGALRPATLAPVSVDGELRAALVRAGRRAAPAAVELRAPRIDRFDTWLAPAALAQGLDRLFEALVERAPRGSLLVVTLERRSPERAAATVASAAPPPSRELELRTLREYARLRTGRAPIEAGSAMAQARTALEQAGAELHRTVAEAGSSYRIEFGGCA